MPPLSARTTTWGLCLLGAMATSSVGCTPNIGDSCTLSTDCASDGTRVCDTSEPGGYCTVLNCTGNSLGATCPNGSYCVLFNANVPGCPASSQAPSRIGESFCMAGCSSNSDCRDDYSCRLPSSTPWNGYLLDPNQTATVCIEDLWFVDGGVSPLGVGYDGSLDAIPPVCQASGPMFDAGFPPLDAGVDATPDAGGKGDAGRKDGGKRDAAPDAKGDGASTRDGAPPKDAGHG